MSDSTANLDQVLASQAQKEASVNALLDAASPSTIFGRRASTCALLTFGYYGGRLNGSSVANGTVSATASNTNYVVAHRGTLAVTIATTNTNWNDTTTYGRMYLLTAGASSITAYEDHRSGTGGILPGGAAATFTGGTLTSAINYAPTVTIASGSTVNIGAAAGNYISVTGTTTITAFDTIADGAMRIVTFTGILILTHNGTSLILPGAANITTAAGDVAAFISLGSGNWKCIVYARSGGQPGYLEVPQNSKSAAYTTVMADSGKHILHPSADTTARVFTIDSNTNVPYPLGTAITFVNENGAGVITIAITSDTMRLAGAGTTGSRTLAANGIATALKIASTSWIISGTGLT